jgi:hypothetical protein
MIAPLAQQWIAGSMQSMPWCWVVRERYAIIEWSRDQLTGRKYRVVQKVDLGMTGKSLCQQSRRADRRDRGRGGLLAADSPKEARSNIYLQLLECDNSWKDVLRKFKVR